MNIPETMRALELDQYDKDLSQAIKNLRVVSKPIPRPQSGQVLIRMEAAPCNPSDLMFLQAKYGVSKDLPAVPGWEGAGTVVENGGGALGWFLKGKRVACGGQASGDGTWAEYYLCPAKNCVPLNNQIPFEQAASFLINPLTAYGMVETAKRGGHAAIVQTAAASQLGRMVVHLAKLKGIPVINIVRRQEQVDLLKSEGAEIVLNSESEGFEDNLKETAKKLNATIAFEAIAGPMTGVIVNALPENAITLIYGALSERTCEGISPGALIFGMQRVEGFWLTKWLMDQGLLGTMRAASDIKKLMVKGTIQTSIYKKVSLEEAPEALLEYSRNMTKGKIILSPAQA